MGRSKESREAEKLILFPPEESPPSPSPENLSPNQENPPDGSGSSSNKGPEEPLEEKRKKLLEEYGEDKAARKRKKKKAKPEEAAPPIELDPSLFGSLVSFPFDYIARVKHNPVWKLSTEERENLTVLVMAVVKKHLPKIDKWQEEAVLIGYVAVLIYSKKLSSKKPVEKPAPERVSYAGMPTT